MLASEKYKGIHINVTKAVSYVKVQMFMCAHLFFSTGLGGFSQPGYVPVQQVRSFHSPV